MRKNLFSRARLAYGALGIAAAGIVLAPAVVHNRPARHAARVQAPEWADLIVSCKGPLTAAQRESLRKIGAVVYRDLPLINAVAVRIPQSRAGDLAAIRFVRHASPDLAVRKCDEFTVGSSLADVAVQQYSATGSGIGVAVLDSGVQPVPDLAVFGTNTSRIVKSVSFVPGVNSAQDGNGHGTHVAGIVAGNGYSSTGSDYFRTFYGIARGANIVNVRVLDSNGGGSVSTVISGLQWVVNNRAAYNIRVINLSLGHPVGESYTTDPLCQAVEAAWKAGIVVVCAAGNEGRKFSSPTAGQANEGYGTNFGSIQSPANDPYVITVGASKSADGIRDHDRIATYSARGPSRLDFVLKPDIIAPGNRVISLATYNAYLENTYATTNNVLFSYYTSNSSPSNSRKYFYLSGTSMAAPVVAGAAALLLQANPSLTPDAVKARLMLSADKFPFVDGATDVCSYGAGYLNIPAALASTANPSAFALSPRLYRDNMGSVHLDLPSILQGTQYIWGDETIGTAQQVWGLQYIWGDDVPAGSQYIWGDAVWGDQYIWGDSSTSVDLSGRVIQGEP